MFYSRMLNVRQSGRVFFRAATTPASPPDCPLVRLPGGKTSLLGSRPELETSDVSFVSCDTPAPLEITFATPLRHVSPQWNCLSLSLSVCVSVCLSFCLSRCILMDRRKPSVKRMRLSAEFECWDFLLFLSCRVSRTKRTTKKSLISHTGVLGHQRVTTLIRTNGFRMVFWTRNHLD